MIEFFEKFCTNYVFIKKYINTILLLTIQHKMSYTLVFNKYNNKVPYFIKDINICEYDEEIRHWDENEDCQFFINSNVVQNFMENHRKEIVNADIYIYSDACINEELLNFLNNELKPYINHYKLDVFLYMKNRETQPYFSDYNGQYLLACEFIEKMKNKGIKAGGYHVITDKFLKTLEI